MDTVDELVEQVESKSDWEEGMMVVGMVMA